MATRDSPGGGPVGDAYEVAVRFLANRARSVVEIRRHLRSKRFDEAAIDRAIDALRAQRYVDDEAFVRYWVDQRARFRQKGDRALVTELLQKGVARETIDLVLGERDPGAELRQAREALRRPLVRWLTLDEPERKRKIHAHLAQRGFSYDTIEEILAHPEDDEGGPEAEEASPGPHQARPGVQDAAPELQEAARDVQGAEPRTG